MNNFNRKTQAQQDYQTSHDLYIKSALKVLKALRLQSTYVRAQLALHGKRKM